MDDVLAGRGIGGWLAEGQDIVMGHTIWGEHGLVVQQVCQGAMALRRPQGQLGKRD